MGLFSKKNLGFTESTFECKRGDLFVRGLEYRPEGENLPIAIVSHGFMMSHKSVRKYAQALAALGYVAYCYDFCGGSMFKNKSDGISTQMSVLTEVSDLEAVIAYAQSRDYTSNELLLMGCSQGGFVSALTAAKHPELVSKLVLFYPALCIPDDARAGNMIFAKFDPKNIPEVVNCGLMKLGRCYPEAVMEMDSIEAIRSYPGPVMI
ncbi:MAG: alpha/beta fold hydrolase, partial [Oscillospiraceae bacterium]|nr:alpha/beta fold hydrolase [Oscillospiraceae bacterium]